MKNNMDSQRKKPIMHPSPKLYTRFDFGKGCTYEKKGIILSNKRDIDQYINEWAHKAYGRLLDKFPTNNAIKITLNNKSTIEYVEERNNCFKETFLKKITKLLEDTFYPLSDRIKGKIIFWIHFNITVNKLPFVVK